MSSFAKPTEAIYRRYPGFPEFVRTRLPLIVEDRE